MDRVLWDQMKKKNNNNNGGLIIVGFIFFLGGLGATGGGIYNCVKVNAAKSWPTVNGIVIETSVETNYHDGSEGRRGSYSYSPLIKYQYEVDGNVYESNKIAFFGKGYQFAKKSLAYEKINIEYPKGEEVAVCYDPLNPQSAVLEPGKIAIKALITGPIFLIMGFLAIVIGKRNQRKAKEQQSKTN